MTRYQLAKLIALAGGMKSRKRIQKTVHLLQIAGCQLGVSDFRIHYYGPYSKSLAKLVDELAGTGVLIEELIDSDVGTQYEYTLAPTAESALTHFERTEQGRHFRDDLERFRDLLANLCQTRPRVLELASTIAAFQSAGCKWPKAVSETAGFKNEHEQSEFMDEAKRLASSLLKSNNGAS